MIYERLEIAQRERERERERLRWLAFVESNLFVALDFVALDSPKVRNVRLDSLVFFIYLLP